MISFTPLGTTSRLCSKIFPDVLHFLVTYLEHHPGLTCTIVGQPTSSLAYANKSSRRPYKNRIVLMRLTATSKLSRVSFEVSERFLHSPDCLHLRFKLASCFSSICAAKTVACLMEPSKRSFTLTVSQDIGYLPTMPRGRRVERKGCRKWTNGPHTLQASFFAASHTSLCTKLGGERIAQDVQGA